MSEPAHQGESARREALVRELVAIWSEVLGVPEDRIVINKSLFQLGGTSTHVLRLVYLLQEHLQLNVSVTDLYTRSSISQLMETIDMTATLDSERRR